MPQSIILFNIFKRCSLYYISGQIRNIKMRKSNFMYNLYRKKLHVRRHVQASDDDQQSGWKRAALIFLELNVKMYLEREKIFMSII